MTSVIVSSIGPPLTNGFVVRYLTMSGERPTTSNARRNIVVNFSRFICSPQRDCQKTNFQEDAPAGPNTFLLSRLYPRLNQSCADVIVLQNDAISFFRRSQFQLDWRRFRLKVSRVRFSAAVLFLWAPCLLEELDHIADGPLSQASSGVSRPGQMRSRPHPCLPGIDHIQLAIGRGRSSAA